MPSQIPTSRYLEAGRHYGGAASDTSRASSPALSESSITPPSSPEPEAESTRMPHVATLHVNLQSSSSRSQPCKTAHPSRRPRTWPAVQHPAPQLAGNLDDLLCTLPRLGSEASDVYLLDEHTVLKTGRDILLQEAGALHFVHANTSVPVPRVLESGIVPSTGHPYILMERLGGTPLADLWDDMSGDARRHVVAQLADVYRELRTHTHNSICGILARPAAPTTENDDNTTGNAAAAAGVAFDPSGVTDNFFGIPQGPFVCEADFFACLADVLRLRGDTAWTNNLVVPMLRSMLAARGAADKTYFTHGQLSPRNVLIDGDSEVVGVLDWSEAGFYPDHWEYVKAHFGELDSAFVAGGAIPAALGGRWDLELAVMLHAKDIIW